jgi:hypothetical protein
MTSHRILFEGSTNPLAGDGVGEHYFKANWIEDID